MLGKAGGREHAITDCSVLPEVFSPMRACTTMVTWWIKVEPGSESVNCDCLGNNFIVSRHFFPSNKLSCNGLKFHQDVTILPVRSIKFGLVLKVLCKI